MRLELDGLKAGSVIVVIAVASSAPKWRPN